MELVRSDKATWSDFEAFALQKQNQGRAQGRDAVRIQLMIGESKVYSKQFEDARAVLNRLIEDQANNPKFASEAAMGLLFVAQIWQAEGSYEKARECFIRASSFDFSDSAPMRAFPNMRVHALNCWEAMALKVGNAQDLIKIKSLLEQGLAK